jgi:DNA-binding transcriptional LysR family regulator
VKPAKPVGNGWSARQSAGGSSEAAVRAAQDLIDSRRLFYFYHVARLGSFSTAEAVLDIAQPAMSRQIAQLESDLGTQLLERSRRGVTLTPTGAMVFRHAEGILADMSRVHADIQAADSQPVGQISLAAPTFFVRRFMRHLLPRFTRAFPNVRLRIVEASTGQVSEMLAAGHVDLAVILQAPGSQKVVTQELLSEHMDLVVAEDHPLASRQSIDRKELAGLAFCFPVNPHGARQLFDEWCADGGIRVDIRLEADSMYLTKYAVRHLGLLGFLPAADCEPEDQIVNVPVDPPIVRRQYLARMRDREDPLLTPLIEEIVATVRRGLSAERTKRTRPAPRRRKESP